MGDRKKPISSRRWDARDANDPDFDRGTTNVGGELFTLRGFAKSKDHQHPNRHPRQQRGTSNASLSKHKAVHPLRQDGDGAKEGAESESSDGEASQATLPSRAKQRNHMNVEDAEERGYNMPDLDSLVREVQSVYSDITKLESNSAKLYAELEDRPFDHNEWTPLFKCYKRLMDRYYDFVFLAYHPSGTNIVKSLVKKYKIPIRMWNKGLFKFLEQLKHHRPKSHEMISKFTFHSYNLFAMLTQPPYECRGILMEGLGDLARFQLQIPHSSDFHDWRRSCYIWYMKAFQKSPTVGRLQHHCGVVASHRLDSFYHFCKGLDTQLPFTPIKDVLSTFLTSIDKEREDSVEASGPFLKLHNSILFDRDDRDSQKWLSMLNSRISTNTELRERGAIVAICNIQAILGYAIKPNFLSSSMKSVEPSDAPLDESALNLAFITLEWYLQIGPPDNLPHLVVWLLFMLDLPASFDMAREWETFPFETFITTLNSCFETTRQTLGQEVIYPELLAEEIDKWKATLDPEADLLAVQCKEAGSALRVPSQKQRPLPEEVALLGFAWHHSTLSEEQLADLDEAWPDELTPGATSDQGVTLIRPLRVVEFALRLCRPGSWLQVSSSGFYMAASLESNTDMLDLMTQEDFIAEAAAQPPRHENDSPIFTNYIAMETSLWWYDLDKLAEFATMPPLRDALAISGPQLNVVRAVGQANADAADAFAWIVEGIVNKEITLFSESGRPLTLEDFERDQDEMREDNTAQFIENLRKQNISVTFV